MNAQLNMLRKRQFAIQIYKSYKHMCFSHKYDHIYLLFFLTPFEVSVAFPSMHFEEISATL